MMMGRRVNVITMATVIGDTSAIVVLGSDLFFGSSSYSVEYDTSG